MKFTTVDDLLENKIGVVIVFSNFSSGANGLHPAFSWHWKKSG